MNAFALAALGAAGAYAALNAAAAVWNRFFALPQRRAFPDVSRLLVVAPHQDDEAIMAGGLMARLAGRGAEIRVIMVTDGVTVRPGGDEARQNERRQTRYGETVAALASLGVGPGKITFLGIPAEDGLRDPVRVRQAIEAVAGAMMELRPDAVIAPAFEAGHPDHDATNYVVSRAARQAGVSADRLYEACEYNGYFLSSSVFARLNPLMLVRFLVAPRFIPGRNAAMQLDMSAAELARKRALLRHYRSQKPDVLVTLFGFPDQFRVMEAHDYSRGPYDPAQTMRGRLRRLLGRPAERFDYGITLAGYAELYGALEGDARAA